MEDLELRPYWLQGQSPVRNNGGVRFVMLCMSIVNSMLGSFSYIYIHIFVCKDYEAMAMAPSQERPDPLAKNFKCWKVVAVGADAPTTEVPLGDSLVEQVHGAISTAVPPSYGEQGKPRGRKPKTDNQVKGVKGKRGAKAKKAKRGKGKRRAILKASSSKPTASTKSADEPPKKTGKKRRAIKPVETATPSASSSNTKKKRGRNAKKEKENPKIDEVPEVPDPQHGSDKKKSRRSSSANHPKAEVAKVENADVTRELEKPDDCVDPPEHVTGHSLYSAAYRRALKEGGDKEMAKAAGKKASELFRVYHVISPSLSGNPRAPREGGNAAKGGA